MNNRKVISIISVAAGITFLLSGLFGSIFYIFTVIESSKLADKSLIFWYSPFLLFGIMFIIAGTLCTVMGFKSFKGDEGAYKSTKVLLIILSAIIFVIVIFLLINSYIL